MSEILYSQQFDSDYLEAAHLDGPVTLEIKSVVPRGTAICKKDKKPIDKPIIYFTKGKRGWVVNKTNGKVLAQMFGNRMSAYVGKSITLFPTTCVSFGVKDTPCIRVKYDATCRPSIADLGIELPQ